MALIQQILGWGDVVAVYGAGLVGLGVMAACSHRGCVVIAIDLEQNRLEVAQKLGADYLINGSTQNVVEELQKIAPEGADVVFESTGVPCVCGSGNRAVQAARQICVSGALRHRTALLSICTAPRQTADHVLSVRRRFCSLSTRCAQEHGDRRPAVAPYDYTSRRIGGLTNLLRRYQQR